MTSSVGQQTGPVRGCVVGLSSVSLWGLTSEERIRRQLKTAGVELSRAEGGLAELAETGSVVLLRADHLYDARTVRDLIARPKTLLAVRGRDGHPVALGAHVGGSDVATARRWLEGDPECPQLPVETPETLSDAYVANLLKSDPPTVLPIRPENRRALERHLFDGSYKGVTDLVTKWVWPLPARWMTGVLARAGIRPNTVTCISLALVVAAAVLFAAGHFAIGLVFAWLMTFLDTVDGKLARVTVDSTTFGHVLDHGMDIVHPPFWYIAWGFGLAATPFAFTPPALDRILVWIVAGYVLGRLFEGAFDFFIGKFSVFTWRPIDSYFRLVMARRNPNLLLLTAALLAGRPDRGLIAVAIWTIGSTVFLAVRLAAAIRSRWTDGPLRPWLAEVRDGDRKFSAVARPFARHKNEMDLSLSGAIELGSIQGR